MNPIENESSPTKKNKYFIGCRQAPDANSWILKDKKSPLFVESVNISNIPNDHLLNIVRKFRDGGHYTFEETDDLLESLVEREMIGPELSENIKANMKLTDKIFTLTIKDDLQDYFFVFNNYQFNNLVKQIEVRGLKELQSRV